MAGQTDATGHSSPATGLRPVPGTDPSRLIASGRAEAGLPLRSGALYPSLLAEPMLELELALAHFERQRPFAETVAEAARSTGGVLLFELPTAGLVPDCSRLAVLSLPSGPDRVTVFACLDLDGETIRVEAPSEQTRPISDFADAFMNLMQRI